MTIINRFLRDCIFSIKTTLREKSFIFWNLLYPLILAALFNLAFGGLLSNKFEPIKVGIAPDSKYTYVLKRIKAFELKPMNDDDAKESLKKGEIVGYINGKGNLMIEKAGIQPTVIKGVLDLIHEIKSSGLPFQKFRFDITYVKHLQQKEASITVIFYSLIGSVALSGMYAGIQMVYIFQGNLSPLGSRVQTSPINKLNIVLSGFLTGVALNLINNLLLIAFMRYVLLLNLFEKLNKSIILIVISNFLGVSLGIFLSASNKMNDEKKMMIATMTSLILSALSGMMGNSLKQVVETYVPVINRINPVSIISDNMYRLNFLQDTSRFREGLTILVIETLIFLTLSFMLLRREQYDSI